MAGGRVKATGSENSLSQKDEQAWSDKSECDGYQTRQEIRPPVLD